MNTNHALISMSVPVHSFEAYAAYVRQIPFLEAEEEQALAKRFQEHGDLAAAKSLVLSHLRFVVRVARDYAGFGLPVADLVQEGNVGLMKAVKRFDPTIGVRLVSFAVHWIKSEIHDYILKNWRIVKIATTKAQRKLFFNLRKFKPRLGWFSEQEIADVATELKVPAHEVVEMERRLNAADVTFDVDVDDEDNSHKAPIQYLADQSLNPENALAVVQSESQEHGKLYLTLESLDPRLRTIIQRRYLDEDKATLHDLAHEFNISAERVRQLEQQAFALLKKAFTQESLA